VSPPSTHGPLLRVSELRVDYVGERGRARVVDGVSFSLEAERCLGLIGESGSGKSLTALAVMGLLPGRPTLQGSVLVGGEEVVGARAGTLRRIRGRKAGLVFQEPGASLDPLMRCEAQLCEVIRVHSPLARAEARARALELLHAVGLPSPQLVARAYPHELSGGMQQRVAIALALAAEPSLIIADEPTTALDPRVQARILRLLHDLRCERGLGLLLISHDLAAVAELADDLAVMYAGRIVERGPLAEVLEQPWHPYTQALLRALPRLDGEPPKPIPGRVPDPLALPPGCRFRPRCPHAEGRCGERPQARRHAGRLVACHLPLAGPPAVESGAQPASTPQEPA